jgi:PAS domain S-box-containing protein
VTATPQPSDRLRVLCLEDSRLDADLVGRTLREAGYQIDLDVVSSRADFESALRGGVYDVILADYTLPGFDARSALEMARVASPSTPFICVSGTIGEEATVDLLKAGAVDCVLKDRLARLPFAVQRALDERARLEDKRAADESVAAAAVVWRETFDAMRDSVAVFDRNGLVLRCNTATLELTGRGFDELLGKPCFEAFHGLDQFLPHCPQRRAFATRRAEMTVFEQDGRWLRATFVPRFGPEGEIIGGVHVVSDVTELKQAESQLLESARRQQAVTDGVIAALARNVEVRDPYTAGHERRVSELAVAIAFGMGLDEEVVRGVQVAARLHDVGKLVIPAEILSKPGHLSAAEVLLIREHSRAGYDVLEPIEFTWPVAQIALQHHERLDGSGYPAGLAGDEILLEARILAVADVVEAMISHRPYRAALSLDEAIAELEEGAGRRYDPAVCTVAIRLFRDEGFAFGE